MKITPSQRTEQFKKGVFSELASLKQKKMNEGFDVIDLSIGSPDLSPPSFVMEAIAKEAMDSTQYGYTLTGTQEFHEAVAYYYKEKFMVDLSEDEILQVTGSQDGLTHLPMLLASNGDYILAPDPGYTAYQAGAAMAEAELYPMPLKEENNFLPDFTEIPEEVAERAKLMILNFPGNPVPAIASERFYKEAIDFAKRFNIIVISDFAYSELIYDGIRPVSFMEIEGAKEVGVEFNSLSKSFNMAGCRIGYVVGNQTVINLLRILKSNLDYGIFSPIQKAAVTALRNGKDFTEQLREIYVSRRDKLIGGLRGIGWNVESPKATMFIWAKVPDGWKSTEFAYVLIEQAGVVVTPGSAFGKYGEGYVRIALVQPENRLLAAVEKISKSGILRNITDINGQPI
ncbi:LL-diaminopimelate aminotransferase [Pseudalkalibacillus caeni]|uniref:Aminotransferase n=1 Tax=Exobacillus caeni TaxID=2574798 RepID=A0A5R9EX55_9BACL|nr:LL-diaminopimelate aminotransferase [Pseudalkalibacillus caeni]TLS35441.1 LL-diaminopimelate aminotransferase [Pseudalkalibacillus caeni]